MSYIKPVFRHVSKENKAKFSQSQCLLTISVGQEVHEGEKFAATVELVNESFSSCIMLIDDSLQRHTMALNSKENSDSFYDISVKEGSRWLIRNKKYYDNLTILNKIVRWDLWLKHPNYFIYQNKIRTLLKFDPLYNAAFNATIDEFLRRYQERLDNPVEFDKERAYRLCTDYLVEECTAMCLWPELECQFEVYPSIRNEAMAKTHQYFVLPYYSNLLHAVPIKFKNRKQFKPQYFELLQAQLENVLVA